MRTKIIWFAVGFLASGLTWAVITAVRAHPRDYTTNWLPGLKDTLVHTWLTNAVGWKHGPVTVFFPADKSSAAMQIQFSRGTGLPGIDVADDGTNGMPGKITFADRAFRYLSIELAGGRFTSISYSTGIKTSSVFYTDSNCDGEYDMAMGPGRGMRVRFDGRWYPLVFTNKQRMVLRDSELIAVTQTNGVWRLVNDGFPTTGSSVP